MTGPDVKAFFDKATNTVSYVVADPATQKCAIIDSVLDYDPAAGRTAHVSADLILAYIAGKGLTVEWILETHVHADHLTAAPYLREKTGAAIGIGSNITIVQTVFAKIFNAEAEFRKDGSQFYRLLADGDSFSVGSIKARAINTPGHTPACMVYVIGDAAFVGDTIFMPDFGTARCDFPGGDPRVLFRSIKRIFELPPETRLFMCHDYKAPGRDAFAWECTVAEQRANNIHVRDGISEDDFVAMRTTRDKQLGMPSLILPAVQLNMRAGAFPPAENNGTSYIKIPLNAL